MTENLSATVFLDSEYAIALVNKDDALHPKAVGLAESLEARRTRLLTTRAILVEIGDGLSKVRYRQVAGELIGSLQQDPLVEIVELSEPLYAEGLALYRSRRDKSWGLTDCVSFITMTAHKVNQALTYDIHFVQAGFQALLR